MHTFQYLPPGEEEQRAFLFQLLGTFIGVLICGFLYLRASDFTLKGVLIGAGIATLWQLGRSAMGLERRAQRALQESLSVDDEALHLHRLEAQDQKVLWQEISDVQLSGGRLKVVWDKGQLTVGARELRNGMEFVRLVTQHHSGGSDSGADVPGNFISLTPR